MTNYENYLNRHLRWQDISITQLSTVNNFLLATSTALIGFVFQENILQRLKVFQLGPDSINSLVRDSIAGQIQRNEQGYLSQGLHQNF